MINDSDDDSLALASGSLRFPSASNNTLCFILICSFSDEATSLFLESVQPVPRTQLEY